MKYTGTLIKNAEVENPAVPNNTPVKETVTGNIIALPEIGERFNITNKDIPGRTRSTSLVQKIVFKSKTMIIFHTFNSIYQLNIETSAE